MQNVFGIYKDTCCKTLLCERVKVHVVYVSVGRCAGQASFSLHTSPAKQNITSLTHMGWEHPKYILVYTHTHMKQDAEEEEAEHYSRVHSATVQCVLLRQTTHSTLKPPAALGLSAGLCPSYASSARNTTAA